METVTICIPTIVRRSQLLNIAIESVINQTHPCQISVHIDHNREGAWVARNNTIKQALQSKPDWIGFLDDDDYLLPHHVEFLLNLAQTNNADMAWSWFKVEGGIDPFPIHRGKQFDPTNPHIFPITYLVRAYAIEYAIEQGGFQPDQHGIWDSQDLPVVQSIWKATNGKFIASPEITWVWRHHKSNTSGLPNR